MYIGFLLTLIFSLSLTLAHPYSSYWTSLAPIPSPRQEHTTLFLPPSTLAIVGGVILSNDTNLFPPFATTSLLQFYSIKQNTWSSRASLPMPLNHANAAVVNGKIYVLGGLKEVNDTRGRAWRATGESWMYDPLKDTWSDLPNLPAGQERGSAAVGVYDGKIYLAGGLTELEFYGNMTQSSSGAVSVFDTRSRMWRAAKDLPGKRDHAGAAVVGEKMYVLGGRDNGQANKRDTVFVLDLCNVEAGWETSAARMPTARGGIASGVVGHKVYTFGGEGDTSVESGVFDEVEAYDTVTDTWESVGKMKIPRHGTYAAGVGGKIYIPGGGVLQGGAPVADFDVFTP